MKLLEQIFSIKNNDNHKIITLFGIKIKINFKFLFQLKQIIFIPKYIILKQINKNNIPACFIITKFNIAIRYNGYNNKKVEEDRNIHLNDEYLTKRFELFEKYYIPSLLNQTDKDFKIIVLFHTQTPEFFKTKIEEYKKIFNGNFFPIFTDVWDIEKIKQTIKANSSKEWLMSIRMDNDDGIARDFIETSKKYFCPINKMFVSYYNGVQLLEKEDNTKDFYIFNRRSWHYFVFIEKLDSHIITAYNYDHGKVWKKFFNFLLIESPQKPMWLEVVHKFNVSNTVDFSTCKRLPKELEKRFVFKEETANA